MAVFTVETVVPDSNLRFQGREPSKALFETSNPSSSTSEIISVLPKPMVFTGRRRRCNPGHRLLIDATGIVGSVAGQNNGADWQCGR